MVAQRKGSDKPIPALPQKRHGAGGPECRESQWRQRSGGRGGGV